ncbi:MAG: hypothetical protein ABFD64_07515 [Armatimonadota bacterium]
MAWELRNGCGPYYTRSIRRGRQVIRQYVGKGLLGEQAAQADVEMRLERDAKQQEETESLALLKSSEGMVIDLYDAVETITRAQLLQAGYHRHNRSEWRKRR